MFERLGAGVMARIAGRARRPGRAAEDYEAALAPMYAWIHAIAQRGRPRSAAARLHGGSVGAGGR